MSTKPKSADSAAADTGAAKGPDAPTTGAEEAPKSGNNIPKSSLTSAVTSDLPQEAPKDQPTEQEGLDPATEAGIGLVRVDGIDFRYVGIAPAREGGKAETPGGIKITPENSTFTPLPNVPFSNSIRVKDAKSGEFYYPADGITSWEQCEFKGSKLIPAKKAAKA